MEVRAYSRRSIENGADEASETAWWKSEAISAPVKPSVLCASDAKSSDRNT
jgi:hypothetical protein